jgi:predicted TIM-barrel fold metal-dependent hydrolase
LAFDIFSCPGLSSLPALMSYHAHFHEKIHGHREIRPAFPLIDSHLHFVDFIQESDGAHRLLKAMDAGGLTKAVVFGLPVKKKWDFFEPRPPHYYLDDNSRCYYYPQTDDILALEIARLAKKDQRRFAPLLCGFNPTDRYAVRDVERMLERYPIWRGVGELLLRHDDLTNMTNEEVARINHPALFEVFRLCAQQRLPILIHHNSTSVSVHDEYEHLHEVEETLEKFPETIFVWAHCGISRRVFHKKYHEMVATFLSRYPDFYMDLAWVVYDEVICDDLEPKKHWLDLIHRFPDRFCLGSDLCGHFDSLGKAMARYNSLLKKLDPGVREKVAVENAEKLWFK